MKRSAGWLCGLWFLATMGCGASGDLAASGAQTRVGSCTLIGCDSGAHYMGDFSLGGADPTTLEFSQCINGVCATAPVQPYATSKSSFSCATPQRSYCEVFLRPDTATASLWLRILPPRGTDPSVSLQEGDRYEVTLGIPGQAPLVKLSATAGYRTTQPNGPGCAPVCKQVALLPVP